MLSYMITLTSRERAGKLSFLQAEIVGYALQVFHFAFDVVFLRHRWGSVSEQIRNLFYGQSMKIAVLILNAVD